MFQRSKKIRCAALLAVFALAALPDVGFCLHCFAAAHAVVPESGCSTCVVSAASSCCAESDAAAAADSAPLPDDCGGPCTCCQDLPKNRPSVIDRLLRTPDLTSHTGMVPETVAADSVTFHHRAPLSRRACVCRCFACGRFSSSELKQFCRSCFVHSIWS